MLNVKNIEIVRYKAVKEEKLDSITQIVFSYTRCPHLCSLKVTTSHRLTVVGAVTCCW